MRHAMTAVALAALLCLTLTGCAGFHWEGGVDEHISYTDDVPDYPNGGFRIPPPPPEGWVPPRPLHEPWLLHVGHDTTVEPAVDHFALVDIGTAMGVDLLHWKRDAVTGHEIDLVRLGPVGLFRFRGDSASGSWTILISPLRFAWGD